MGTRQITNFLKVILAILLLCTFRAQWESQRERSILAILAHTLQDVTARVHYYVSTSLVVWQIYSENNFGKVSMLADIVSSAPDECRTSGQLQNLCKTLGVDEINITDEKGVISASSAPENIGFDMNSTSQTAFFMPALTDKTFLQSQLPQKQGRNSDLLIQYTGMARLDKPGILQIGSHAATIRHFSKVFHVKENLDSIKARPLDWLEISPARRGGRASERPFFVQHRDQLYMCLEAIVDNWRVHLGRPAANQWWISAVPWLYLCDALAAALLCVLCIPRLRRSFPAWDSPVRQCLARSVVLPCSFFARHLLDVLRSSAVQACVLLFIVLMSVAWLVTTRISRHAATVMLTHSLDTLLENNANYLADTPLSFIGAAICNRYRSPEKMMELDMEQLSKEYGVDTISVINKYGIIINSNDNATGYPMGTFAESKKFNCLLGGQRIYSQPFRKSVLPPYALAKYVGVAFPDAPGYIQLGLEFRAEDRKFQYVLKKNCHDLSIWNSGFFVSMDSNMLEIVSSGYKHSTPNETLTSIGGCMPVIQATSPRTPFEMPLYGEDCLCIYDTLQNYTYIAALPISDFLQERNATLATIAVILAIVLAIGAVFASRLTSLVECLKIFIASEKSRLESDMSIAKTVQTSTLPMPLDPGCGIRLDAMMRTAREVGGDFYDYFLLPSGQLFVMIADVSGKGIPAAMFMMRAKTIISESVLKHSSLGEAITLANNELSTHNEAELFVTAWIGIYTPATGQIEYVNAGHNPPVVIHDGKASYLESSPSLVLGGMEDIPYQVHSVTLSKGDRLLLYTDGVTEAHNTQGELFEEERLLDTVDNAQGRLIPSILAAIDMFADGAEQFDDITMVTFNRN